MKQKQFYVYVYCDPRKNGSFTFGDYSFNCEPFYVGKGCGRRWRSHLKESVLCTDGNKHKTNKIKKILDLGLVPVVVKYDCVNEEVALDLETELISLIGRYDLGRGPLTNLTDGGEGHSGYIISEERKQKLRAQHIGLRHTEDAKRKMSESQRKRYENPDERRKCVNTWFVDMSSQEREKRLKDYFIGEKNPNFGNVWSDEQKKIASDRCKQNSNFLNNNPQKINPNRGSKCGKSKYDYLVYDLCGVFLDRSDSPTVLSEKYECNVGCVIKYARQSACYFGYFWMRCSHTDSHEDVLKDVVLLKKCEVHKSGKYRKM